MNNSVYNISLDLHAVGSQLTLNAKAYDTARTIRCTLTENGKPYTISEGCYAAFTAKKLDGNVLFNATTIDDAINYEFTVNTVNAPGEVECEIRLYDGNGKLITSPRFTILVDDTVYHDGDVVESSSEFTALTDLMSSVIRVLGEVPSPVLYGMMQSLTDEEKALARENIGAAGMDAVDEAVEAAEEAAQAAEEAKQAVEAIPDWAKQEKKPNYNANEIKYQNTNMPSRPNDVNKALDDLQDNKQNKLIAGDGINIGEDGKTISATGGTGGIPVAIGGRLHGANDIYTATGENLPEVRAGAGHEQIQHEGKGKQIVFIPYSKNETEHPKLIINGGETIEIRMRDSKNNGSDDVSPDATDLIPVGALLRGVPYTMTFCGKYWLVDSMIGSVGNAGGQVFSAEYGVTPHADMLDAYNAGRSVICNYGGRQCRLYKATASMCIFVADYADADGDYQYSIVVSSANAWGRYTFDRQKPLKDYVDNIVGNIESAINTIRGVSE